MTGQQRRVTAVASVVGLLTSGVLAWAPPATAAAPVVTAYDTASTTLASDADAVYVYVDGWDYGAHGGGGGVVEVFAGSAECHVGENAARLAFTGDGTSSAAMSGAMVLDCYDLERDLAAQAQVEVDLAWSPVGEPVTNRFVSRQTGCVSVRRTAAAAVSGTVRVTSQALALDLTLVPSTDRPAELAHQQDRCRVPR